MEPEILSILKNEFPGEESWSEFVFVSKDVNVPSSLLVLRIEKEILKALIWKKPIGEEKIKKWLISSSNMLSGISPLELYNKKNGKVMIKTMIMRLK